MTGPATTPDGRSLRSARETTRTIPVEFVLTTEPNDDNPNPGYTHRCVVTLFGRTMWTLWGKSAEDADKNAQFEIASRLRVLRGY